MGNVLFWDNNEDTTPYDDNIFKDSQQHVNQINERSKALFTTKFAKVHKDLLESIKERNLLWNRKVMGKDGLAMHCKRLHNLMKKVEETQPGCDEAQEELNKQLTLDIGADRRELPTIYGCADTAYTRELRTKKCEKLGDPLACHWFRTHVIQSISAWQMFDPPNGKCIVSPDSEMNRSLMTQDEFNSFSNMLWGSNNVQAS